jgi:hypothetical protein
LRLAERFFGAFNVSGFRRGDDASDRVKLVLDRQLDAAGKSLDGKLAHSVGLQTWAQTFHTLRCAGMLLQFDAVSADQIGSVH